MLRLNEVEEESGWRRPTENFFFSSDGPATDIVVILSTLANLIIASGICQLCCPRPRRKANRSAIVGK